MKELYTAPELEIITFVPVEQIASGYLTDYMRSIGADSLNSDEIDVPLSGDPIY